MISHRFLTPALTAIALLATLAQAPKCVARVYGTELSSTTHASADFSGGIRVAQVAISWAKFETSDGTFNSLYMDSINSMIAAYNTAGISVIIDLGMHTPPAWVWTARGMTPAETHLKNQYGDQWSQTQANTGKDMVNGVYNATVRLIIASYVQAALSSVTGVGANPNLFAVKAGWGTYGEIGYPFSSYMTANGVINTNCYWGFDGIAQGTDTSVALPIGVSACPVPGWIPGTTSTGHTNASQYINWYLNSLENYQNWQIKTVRLYFSGHILVEFPSWGLRPGYGSRIDDLTAAIDDDLNGSSFAETSQQFGPDGGQVQRGYDFARLIPSITDADAIVYSTTVACNPTGAVTSDGKPIDQTSSATSETSLDPGQWSPVHYMKSLVATDPHGVTPALFGVNAATGSDHTVLDLAIKRMEDDGLIGIDWIADGDLNRTNPPASLSDFQTQISANQVAPTYPTSISATAGTGEVTVSWSPVPSALYYWINRATVVGGPYVHVGTSSGSATTYMDTGLTSGTLYFYVIETWDGSGHSGDSGHASATPH